MLDSVTPVILTYNESANIARTLDSLRWAGSVVVLDSGSKDETKEIAGRYPNVKWFERAFDSHQAQWEYAVRETGIATDYVLALDADMEVTPEFIDELRKIFLPGGFAGGDVPFIYSYYGRPLVGSLYPNQIRVFRPDAVTITQVDHTQHFAVSGPVHKFRNRIIHDDRKPLERWVASQLSYQVLNDEAVVGNGGEIRGGGFKYSLRRAGIMPPLVGLIAYVRSGGPFGGAASARYAYERMVCESLLAIRLMNRRLKAKEQNVRDSGNN
jgi:glycosyltransferase involved in cell wall biosynthesis